MVVGRGVPWRRLAPWGLVAVAVLFNLVALRAELLLVQNLNDGVIHEQLIRWADRRISGGHLTFDGWYRYLALGSPLFRQYQSLPHTITGYLSQVTGPERAYHLTLYLLLSFWPVAVYAGARLLGWGRWIAGAAALVAPLLASEAGLGFEHGSYTWRGSGVWTQLWAMWTLPLAWGLSWQAVAHRRRLLGAALAVGFTVAFHFVTGYLALMALGIWAVVTFRGFPARLGRAVLVGAGGLLIVAWTLVPLLSAQEWTIRSEFLQHTIFADSFGARRILGWLVSGEIYDAGRFPAVTLLVGVGLVVCLARFRRDERARALVGIWLASLVIFFGRSTVGPVLELLPGGDQLLFRRYISGVHLAGIVLAGVGLVTAVRLVVPLLARAVRAASATVSPRLAPGAVVVLVAVLLYPAWAERVRYDARGAELIRLQRSFDAVESRDAEALVELARERGGGRVYAGLRSNWGQEYRIGHVPMFAVLSNRDADAVGFTLRFLSLLTDVEALFDDANLGSYELFNVRYVIAPQDRTPSVPAREIARSGVNVLWEVDTSGYVSVVDTVAPISADRRTLAVQMQQFVRSELPLNRQYPTLAYGDRAPDAPTVAPGTAVPRGSPGEVLEQFDGLDEGFYGADVRADREAVVVLKTAFDPRWRVFVDGVERPTQLLAPGYVGVRVEPGEHEVAFLYRPYPWYPVLGAVSLLGLAGLWWVGRRMGGGPGAEEAGATASPPEEPVRTPA
ncbi:MAG: hypothetical protein HY658_01080 [Actinobacteria bacterium]|nr:hypothetical protein [Actinomycetota bacterium]